MKEGTKKIQKWKENIKNYQEKRKEKFIEPVKQGSCYICTNAIEACINTVSDYFKETRNSFKTWPLNLWWISNKTIIEVEKITKAATFESFLYLSYKNIQLLFLWQCFFNNLIRPMILGVTQKYQLRVSFKY